MTVARIQATQRDLADALVEHARILNRDPAWLARILPDYLRHVGEIPGVWDAYEAMSASRIATIRRKLDHLAQETR